MPRNARVAFLAALLVAVAGLGAPSHAARGGRPIVALANHFLPAETTITKGESLWFANLDPVRHDVTADNGKFRGESATVGLVLIPGVEQLDPGVYPYTCSIHDGMIGILRIV